MENLMGYALTALDVLVTLFIVFAGNDLLWHLTGRRISITIEKKRNRLEDV